MFSTTQSRICAVLAGLLLAGFACGFAAAQNAPSEADLVAVIQGDADWPAKYDAFRALRQVGTAASVPALAALLDDPKLSQMARYALEPMPCPEAGEALCAALNTVTGPELAGIATSLGVRRHRLATAQLTALLENDDPSVAKAAAGALGRIGTVDAVRMLNSADRSDPALAMAVDEGILAAAEQLAADGDAQAAVRVFNALLEDGTRAEAVRLGAFRGLAHAAPDTCPQSLLRAMAGDDAVFRDFAAQLVAETAGDGNTVAYVTQMERLPAEGQVALLRGLATRGDLDARPAVLASLRSEDAVVSAAALKALESLGTAEDVPLLARIMGSGEASADAARATLVALEADGADAALADLTASAGGARNAALLELLVVRGAANAVPTALARLADGDGPTRAAAARALGTVGGVDGAPALIGAMDDGDESVRDAATKGFSAVCAREPEAMLPVVLAALENADVERQVTLLGALRRIGGPAALAPVLARLGADNVQLSDAAQDALLAWPTPDAAPHLLPHLEQADAPLHAAALRSYVRLAQEAGGQAGAMLKQAGALCATREDKWVVLSAWGKQGTVEALDALRPYLDDEDVHNEAAAAIITAAAEFRRRPGAEKAQAREALRLVMEKSQNASIRDRAQRTLERIG